MENKQKKQISPSNSLLTMIIWTTFTLWFLLYDSNMVKLTWGSWIVFKYNHAYPIVTLMVLGLILLFFKNEHRVVLAEQKRKDAEENNKMLKQQFNNALSHSRSIYELALSRNDYELIMRAKHMIDNFGNKLELTELKGHPEVTSFLISKKIESENNNEIIFDFEICSDITKLENIPASDINKVLSIIMDQITEVQKDSEDKEVGVLIRDEDKGTIFEYIYNGVLITQNQDSNVTSTNWHIINKIARKYGGKITAAQEDEYSIIRFWLPHDRPQCRILKTLGS